MKSWPYYSQDEIDTATETLKSGRVNYWTGEQCKLFEKEFAQYHDVKHAIALMNGTVAIEAALYALNIGSGDDVIVTSRTFVASASAVVMRGAKPIMADVDLNSQNITVETIQSAMTPKTKAIICVHLGGWPCDMDSIMAFAKAHNLFVIEDCAQAIGAKYKNKHIGTFGHAAAFSFCQDKIISTGGEGGMLITNDENIFKKVWAYKDHGKDFDTVYHKQHPPGFRWLTHSFGTNWRMTEMQAAIGRKQLTKLAGWVEKRNQYAKLFNEAFSKIDALRVTLPPAEIYHAYYRYYVFVDPLKLKAGLTRDNIINQITERGVPCFSGSCSEIYLEKCFSDNNLMPGKRLDKAKLLGESSLAFLIHPTLEEQDIKKAIQITESIFS